MSHDDIENVGSNTSTAPHLDDIVAARYSRRAVVKGGTASAALVFFAGSQIAGAETAAAHGKKHQPKHGPGHGKPSKGPKIGFTWSRPARRTPSWCRRSTPRRC